MCYLIYYLLSFNGLICYSVLSFYRLVIQNIILFIVDLLVYYSIIQPVCIVRSRSARIIFESELLWLYTQREGVSLRNLSVTKHVIPSLAFYF